MKKQPIQSIYFIKAICAIGIVIFHFGCHATGINTSLITSFENGNWGETLVTVFFAVSGMLLYYHYSGNLKLSHYYWKRWKGIFPMFYLAYLCFWLFRICQGGAEFYFDAPWAYIFTVFGMDGYMVSRVMTYYILGEWFLGAIIILYLLYPVILQAWKKNHVAAFFFTLVLYLVCYDKPITHDVGFRTISSCLISFVFGMLFLEYRTFFVSAKSVIVALFCCVVLYFIKLPISGNMAGHLMGACLLIVLSAVGENIMNGMPARKLYKELGILSYPVFLLHHQILYSFLQCWQPNSLWTAVLFLFGTVCVIVLAAKVLYIVSNMCIKELDRIVLRINNNIVK